MSFDPKQHLMDIRGKDYLQVAYRLVWFREEHPDWGIVTEPVEINMEKQYAIFKAHIFNAEGKLMATAHKMEDIRGFGDYLEKAETSAVGRALAMCGYGTQWAAGDLDEGNRLADAPRESRRATSRNVAQRGTGALTCPCGAVINNARATYLTHHQLPILCVACGKRNATPAADAPQEPPAVSTADLPEPDPALAENGDGDDLADPFADGDGELFPAPAEPRNYATQETGRRAKR